MEPLRSQPDALLLTDAGLTAAPARPGLSARLTPGAPARASHPAGTPSALTPQPSLLPRSGPEGKFQLNFFFGRLPWRDSIRIREQSFRTLFTMLSHLAARENELELYILIWKGLPRHTLI